MSKRWYAILGVSLLFICGCPLRSQPPFEHASEKRRNYLELCRTAVERNDLVLVAWYKRAEDGDTIMNVLFEAEIPAIVGGSVLYSVEVRNQDVEKAKRILRNDKRLYRIRFEHE